MKRRTGDSSGAGPLRPTSRRILWALDEFACPRPPRLVAWPPCGLRRPCVPRAWLRLAKAATVLRTRGRGVWESMPSWRHLAPRHPGHALSATLPNRRPGMELAPPPSCRPSSVSFLSARPPVSRGAVRAAGRGAGARPCRHFCRSWTKASPPRSGSPARPSALRLRPTSHPCIASSTSPPALHPGPAHLRGTGARAWRGRPGWQGGSPRLQRVAPRLTPRPANPSPCRRRPGFKPALAASPRPP